MQYKRLALMIVIILFSTTTIQAASLWNQSKSMYSDERAYKAGDILTIIVSENATATQQASTDVSQTNQAAVGAGTGILDFINPFAFDESDSSSAAGNTSRSGNLSAKVAVRVVKVLPDGNLKISGMKEIIINDERQKINLSGIIRPEDISAGNTIQSNYIANLDINYEGKGVIANKQKPGIITRILNWFF